MRSECTPSNGQDHAEVFRMLATAVQEHLHTQVDADTVRQIARDLMDARSAQAMLAAGVGERERGVDWCNYPARRLAKGAG